MQARTKALNQFKTTPSSRQLFFWIGIIVLALATLACGLLGSAPQSTPDRVNIQARLTRLPTFTPTADSNAATTMMGAGSAGSVPSLSSPIPVNTVPAPAGTPTATVTPIFESSGGWSFASVQIYPDQYRDGLLLYGDVVNNTDSAQELVLVTGTFYDAQGQVIASEDWANGYWPVEIIPPGGRVPIELTVDGIESVANFDFNVETKPSSQTPRQDFEFLDLKQWSEEDTYCLTGRVRNLGGELQDYVVIMVTLYDYQGEVINFGHHYEVYLESILGDDQTLNFDICVDPRNQDIINYDLRAWGQ